MMNGDRPEPGILRLTVELFMLPVRTVLHGMERMVATLKDIQRTTDRGADSFLGGPAHSRRLLPEPPWPAADEPVASDSATTARGGVANPWTEPPSAETTTFREPPTAGGARDGAGEPNSKEDSRMYTDQDLSGDVVKVVQYCIVSVVTTVDDNARVVVKPKVRAFGDDMTPEDFTSWVIATENRKIRKFKRKWIGRHGGAVDGPGPTPWDRKYLRVAFTVLGRFSPADIKWDEVQAHAVARQAHSVARIANKIAPIPDPKIDELAEGDD